MSSIEAIVEIAGGDSFAAAAAYVSKARPKAVLPTYVHTRTEYGDFSIIERHVDLLREDLKNRFGTALMPLEIASDPELWRALNGRFVTEIRKKFGFYSPCIGCHLYLHLMRLPFAAREKDSFIVAGERESHSFGVKINQTSAVLDAYAEVIKSAGCELVMPVRSVTTREELLEWAPWLWEEDGEQMKCVLSGNYRSIDGTPILPGVEQEQRYIQDFLIPAGKALARIVVKGGTGYVDAVADIMRTS